MSASGGLAGQASACLALESIGGDAVGAAAW